MSNNSIFQKVSGRGYDPTQVDAIIDLARQQFENPEQVILRASDLRGMRLDLVRGGYSISEVDLALDNIEDNFVRTETLEFRKKFGEEEVARRKKELTDSIFPRLNRNGGDRFARTSWFSKGYDKKHVDKLLEKLSDHFEANGPISISEIRRVQFKPKRLGYSMPQVDSFLDRVIEALQLEQT